MALCKICTKLDTCKKNKERASNCRLFVPSEEKELELLKKADEARKKLKEIDNPIVSKMVDLIDCGYSTKNFKKMLEKRN